MYTEHTHMHINTGILLSYKPVIHDNISRTGGDYAKWNKWEREKHILDDFPHMGYIERHKI